MSQSSANARDEARPTVHDKRSCERWLQSAPLADPRQACFELTTLLEEIEEAPPSPRHYLEILETMRKAVFVAQEENTKRFAGRPLPLSGTESSAFDQVFDLWTTYGKAYRRLAFDIRDDLDFDNPMRQRLPLLVARGLETICELMLVHYRARREVSAELWHDLHELYAAAEATGVEHDASEDEGSLSPPPFEHYTRQILLHLASPQSLTSRELEWTRRWTRNWAQKAMFTFAIEGREILAVDLEGSEPARRVKKEMGETYRYLDISQIRKSVKKRLQGLASGIPPNQLGLGSDCSAAEAGELLSRLNQHWFETVPRAFKRRLVTGRAELAATLTDIHHAIGGRVERAHQKSWDYTRRDTEQLAVYGGLIHDSSEDGFAVERWEMLDDSASGFRVRRKGPGERLNHLQLVGLKPPGAPTFILCEIRWLVEGTDGGLTLGVQALPGLAQPISARPLNGRPEDQYGPGFILPHSSGFEPSLVLPVGTFREDAILDVRFEETERKVRLVSLMKQGLDYERATFAVIA